MKKNHCYYWHLSDPMIMLRFEDANAVMCVRSTTAGFGMLYPNEYCW